MKRPIYQLNKNSTLVAKLILTTLLMTTASVSAAEETDVAYVDSVLKWGAWELDIEPAAGGLSAATTKALNTRGAKVALRTNSIAALAPPPPERPRPGSDTPVPQRPPTPTLPGGTPTPSIPTAPTISAPPGATPPTVVTLPLSLPPAPTSPAPSGAITATVVTLP